jgi:hypothetical protein
MSYAYATYIVHQWIVAYTEIYPLLVILILSGVSPILAWALGILLKAIPGAKTVL